MPQALVFAIAVLASQAATAIGVSTATALTIGAIAGTIGTALVTVGIGSGLPSASSPLSSLR